MHWSIRKDKKGWAESRQLNEEAKDIRQTGNDVTEEVEIPPFVQYVKHVVALQHTKQSD